MKTLLTLVMFTLSLSTFAKSIEEAVHEVEVERGAECSHIRSSTFSKCFSIPQTCFYSSKYRCLSPEGSFGLTVKVKESYRTDGSGYTTSVRGVKITK